MIGDGIGEVDKHRMRRSYEAKRKIEEERKESGNKIRTIFAGLIIWLKFQAKIYEAKKDKKEAGFFGEKREE